MLEKKDSASSGVLLLCGGSRSLEDEEVASGAQSHQNKLEEVAEPTPMQETTWVNNGDHSTESEEDEEESERPETRNLLENPRSSNENNTPSWQIPIINTPSHSSAIDNINAAIIPSNIEITYFDESGEKCCINSNSINNIKNSLENCENVDNLLIQDSGSQFLFPMDVSLTVDDVQDGSSAENKNNLNVGNLKHVPSACSTLAFEDPEEEVLEVPVESVDIAPPRETALVLGSAPAAPIGVSRGILQSGGTTRINRKNSQVCFRDVDDDETPVTPLLNTRHTNAGDSDAVSAGAAKHPRSRKKDDDDEWELVPPDGGWGWLVLAGSVLVNILVPGTVKSFGVLFVEFLEVFKATPVAASWIPALCYFLYSSLGPVASVLSAKFSYRTVTILGGLFAAFGMILSFFASSITYLYISFGVLVGTGAGLAFPPGVFIVSSYFQKRRGLANGLCISGSAIGSIILPPLLRYLLNLYGYRGAVLIMGGLTFNVLVGAMFYHPVERHMKRVRKVNAKKDQADAKIIVQESEPVEIEMQKSPGQQLAKSQPISIPMSHQNTHQQNSTNNKLLWYLEVSPEQDADWLQAQSASFIGPNIDKASVDNSPSPLALRDVLENSQPDAAASLLSNNEKKIDWDFFSTLPAAKQRLLRLSIRPQSQAAASINSNYATGSGQLSRSFSSNVSLSSFRYISTVHHGSTLAALQQNPPDNELFASTLTLRSVSHSCWESALECARCFVCRCCCWKKERKTEPESPSKTGIKNNNITDKNDDKTDDSSKLLDLSLLKDSLYLVILLSNSTNAIGYTNFIILLPAYAISLGFDKQSASLLLSLVAALDLVGRIGGSALSDLHFMPRKYYYIGGLALSGAMLAFIPLIATAGYTSLSIACAVFGLGSGTYVGVTAVLMADMLGAERLASSFGMSLFLNGVLQLLGPPVCGLALQRLQSYAPIFSMLGIVLLIGAAMWGFIPLIERKRRQQNKELV